MSTFSLRCRIARAGHGLFAVTLTVTPLQDATMEPPCVGSVIRETREAAETTRDVMLREALSRIRAMGHEIAAMEID